jgi:hypothetical protein
MDRGPISSLFAGIGGAVREKTLSGPSGMDMGTPLEHRPNQPAVAEQDFSI